MYAAEARGAHVACDVSHERFSSRGRRLRFLRRRGGRSCFLWMGDCSELWRVSKGCGSSIEISNVRCGRSGSVAAFTGTSSGAAAPLAGDPPPVGAPSVADTAALCGESLCNVIASFF